MILKAILGENGKSKISEADFNALKAYNNEISNGVSPMTAYYKTLQNASDKAVELASSAGKAGVNLDKLTVKAKAGQKALKALKTAGNMLAGMAISFAITKSIELLSEAIDDLIVTNEEYLEQQDEIITKAEEIISSTESRIESLEGLKEKLDETNGSQAKMLELTNDINNVLGEGKSKILDNANALAILNAEIENELRLEKERQELANQEKRDASFNKAKNASSTETAYFNEELTFKELQERMFWDSSNPSKGNVKKNIGELIENYIENHFVNNNSLGVQDIVDYYLKAISKYNTYNNNHPIKISEKELTNVIESALKDLYVSFEDVIDSGEGFLSKSYKQNIVDVLYLKAGGVIDDEWRKSVYESFDVLDSLTEDVHGALEEYNEALTDDIEGNEDVIYESVLSLFDNIKKQYPEISSIIDTWLSDMVTSLQNNIPGKITVDRASIINSIKDDFGVYFQDKTLETFFETNSIDTDDEIIKFKEIAKEAKNLGRSLADAMEEYKEAAENSRFSLSSEDAEVLSDYQSKINKLSSTLSNLHNLTAADITSLMSEFESFDEVFEKFGVDGTAGAGDVKSAIEEIGKELVKTATEKVPQMTNAIKEMYAAISNPKGVRSNMSSEIKNLENILERVRENKTFSEDEYASLITKYDLSGDVKKLADGYSFEEDAIISLINTKIKTYNDIISWEITNLEETLAEKIQNIGMAEYNAISSTLYQLKNSYMEPLKTSAEESVLDTILKEFDAKLSHYENAAKLIDAKLANAEARGYIATQQYYETLKGIESGKKDLLEQQLGKLVGELNKTDFDTNSEEWNELAKEIESTEIAIQESTNAMQEFDNQMRQIDWDLFDFAREQESKLMDEADFMIDLLDSAKLFSEAGEMTAEGLATMGLHAQNYNAYLEQSIDYANEYQKIQKDLAKDPYNTDLIERRNELLELQQESILSAETEKDAMIDLVSEGIEKQKEAFQGLIDEYTEALDVQKDLYDYQKKNSEQTKKIAQIQKQLAAYSGDQSDEARAKVQQLKIQLEEEQSNLESDQYDRYIEDQKEILSAIQDDYEKVLDAYLEDTEKVIADSVNSVNKNAIEIGKTLTEGAKTVGYDLSQEMNRIWTDENGIFATNFKGVKEKLDVLSGIKTDINTLIVEQEKKIVEELQKLTGTDGTFTTTLTGIKSILETISSKMDNINTGGSGSGGVDFINRPNTYTGKLNTDSSLVDLLKYNNFDSSVSARANYYKQMGFTDAYTSSSEQNKAMLEWLKKNGYGVKEYASGGRNLNKQVAWTQEDGTEYIIRPSDGAILTPLAQGDSVLTSEASKNLWNMANNPMEFIKDNLTVSLPNVTTNSSGGSVENNIHMSLSLPGVSNYQEFVTQLQSDKKFEKMIVDVTSSALTGSNSLSKYRHKF